MGKTMFDFFFSKKAEVPVVERADYFGSIEMDIHSHLVPGIDDGSPDLATSLSMIKEMREMGLRKIVTTPHISELYPNDHDTIFDGLIRLKQLIRYEGVDVELTAAAEYMINDMFEQAILSDVPLLTMPKRHVLIEIPHMSEPMNLFRVLTLLNTKGYVPVLAHPERYRFYNKNLFYFEKLKDYQCLFQVNALSLVGYYGNSVADCAWLLMNNRLIDFLGTDFHNEQHIRVFKKNLTPAGHNALKAYPFKNKELALT